MERSAGILMPISSLPSPYGIGTLGREAYRFVDFLQAAGCKVWQVLPLQPTSFGNSPYQTCAANALNPYLIDLECLREDGLLAREDFCNLEWGKDARRVDYGAMYHLRARVLKRAFARFDRTSGEWLEFRGRGKYRDFARFMTLKAHFGGAACSDWGKYAVYDETLVGEFAAENDEEIAFWEFTQYLFLAQWKKLKAYANEHGVAIMGDIPMYLSRDSVEAWRYKKELFLVDEEGNFTMQAGVPPDAFSDEGQLWGNPIYDWARMQKGGFAWWHARILDALELYDILRIDHFIGFIRYYAIPEGASSAKVGEWRKGPGGAVFEGLKRLPIVAEDLGLITDEMRAEIDAIGFPGMKIIQHAFDGNPQNEHKPSCYSANCVAYTGTHDNVTLRTRIEEMQGASRTRMLCDLRSECLRAGIRANVGTDKAICTTILRLLYASKADAVIFPLQDALFMGEEGRINSPSVVSDKNWSFRFLGSDFSAALRNKLSELARRSGRK